MSTVVCQNLTETTATLKLRVAAAPPPAAADDHKNSEFGGWGFLQTVPEKSGDYPPFKKPSFSRLSPKSLELCTENLGSESGTDVVSDAGSIFSSSPPYSPSAEEFTSPKRVEFDDWIQKPKNPVRSGRRVSNNFPPPLSTMSGSGSLQVRHHREGGRLIIEAVEAPFRNSYLQAERSDGRLKLCFLTSSATAETISELEECGNGEIENSGIEFGSEKECGNGGIENSGIEFGSEKECGNGGIENSGIKFESEKEEEINREMVGTEKIQWRSRCKEGSHGSKGLCSSNWKPALWVATS